MKARDYFEHLQRLLLKYPLVLSFSLEYREIDLYERYIKGRLLLLKNYTLQITEYVVTSPEVERLKYRYHIQKPDGSQLCRWDNAPHHPHLSSFPHHKHGENDTAEASEPMDLEKVLQILSTILISES